MLPNVLLERTPREARKNGWNLVAAPLSSRLYGRPGHQSCFLDRDSSCQGQFTGRLALSVEFRLERRTHHNRYGSSNGPTSSGM